MQVTSKCDTRLKEVSQKLSLGRVYNDNKCERNSRTKERYIYIKARYLCVRIEFTNRNIICYRIEKEFEERYEEIIPFI